MRSLDYNQFYNIQRKVKYIDPVICPPANTDSLINTVEDFNDTVPFSTSDYSINSLKCWYTNADSLLNKIDELKCRINSSQPDIVCVTEVFPKHCVTEVSIASVQIVGYTCYCSNFSHNSRGVCMFVKSTFNVNPLDNLNTGGFQESLWCSISVHGSDDIVVGVVYRSPSSTHENDDKLLDLIKDVTRLYSSNLLIVGDFNLPKVDWSSWSTPSFHTISDLFLDTLDDEFLTQHVSFATRFRDGQTPSTLDLIVTRDDAQLEDVSTGAPLGNSDHIMICFEYVCSVHIPTTSNRRYLYERGNYQQFNYELINLDWDGLFSGLSVEAMWNCFHSIYCKLLDKYVPGVVWTTARDSPQWITKFIKDKIKLKRMAWTKYKRSLCSVDYSTYAQCRNECTAAVRKAKHDYENRLVQGINPKGFGNTSLAKPKLNKLLVVC